MQFQQLELPDAFLITLETFHDCRGTFARQFCKKEFEAHGINFEICQCNISENYKRNTIRGLHYQQEPFMEPKIVSCLHGSCYDVIVDLRPNSSTYLKWCGVELNTPNTLIYIPPNFAHGFQTLDDNTVIYYQLGEFFHPEFYAGVRYNDPKIDIQWKKLGKPIMNERDMNYELL